jgi:hypothetical protein
VKTNSVNPCMPTRSTLRYSMCGKLYLHPFQECPNPIDFISSTITKPVLNASTPSSTTSTVHKHANTQLRNSIKHANSSCIQYMHTNPIAPEASMPIQTE